jgi:polygalacturonase
MGIENASFAYFSFSGEVDVAITFNKGILKRAKVRSVIKTRVEDSTVYFSLSEACNLSVEINKDIFHNLHLFANPIDTFHIVPTDKNVIYYAAGVHDIDVLNIKLNQIVFMADGALIRGSFTMTNVKNIRILGHGVIENSAKGITVDHSTNVVIDGLMMLNPKHYTVTVGQSNKVSIRNIKSFSCAGWGDGIDIFCSKDVAIEGAFMRNYDDCIAIYGHRWK